MRSGLEIASKPFKEIICYPQQCHHSSFQRQEPSCNFHIFSIYDYLRRTRILFQGSFLNCANPVKFQNSKNNNLRSKNKHKQGSQIKKHGENQIESKRNNIQKFPNKKITKQQKNNQDKQECSNKKTKKFTSL